MDDSKIVNFDYIIKAMTLEEKASLMSGANFWNTKSIKRLGIPSFMLTDGPHGLRKQGGKADHLGLHKSKPATCFPTSATLANSWDNNLLEKVGIALGSEAAFEDVSVLLGPGMNIKRNPLNGRNFEYFSEDPYLTGKLASSMIKGIQSQGVAACAKHFAVNSQEYHRMSVDEIVDKRALHEVYLKAFKMAVQEGQVKTIMTAYNKVRGVYANESQYLLNDILKKDWDFEGLIVTDWGGNNDRVKALKAGNQLEMPATNGMTDQDIVRAVENNQLDEEVLNERVSGFLLFNQWLIKNKQTLEVDYHQHHQLAIEAAKKSMVLLKNANHVLPLNNDDTYLIVGDFAENPRYQGAGSSLINPTRLDSLLDAFKNSKYTYGYTKGYHRYGKASSKLIEAAVTKAQDFDKIILFMGLDESSEAEGVDRKDMKLPKNQLKLLKSLAKLEKSIIVVLAGGSAVEIPFIQQVDAILHSYLPGQGGGKAVLDVLAGEYNPSGKLSETYPVVYEDVPSSNYYPGDQATSEHRESIFIGYRYFDTVNKEVNYPFGHGLSYSQFEYSNLRIDDMTVSLDLENVGDYAGAEVVQVYFRKLDSNIIREKQELIGYKKVYLKQAEKQALNIELDKENFKFFNQEKDNFELEAGAYEIVVGSSSRDIHLKTVIRLDGFNYEDQDKELKKYANYKLAALSQEDFQQLIEYKLPNPNWNQEKTLSYNDLIKQSQYKSNFGKFINFSIDTTHQLLMKINKPIAANNVIFAQNLPYRGLARMSNGMVDEKMLDGILLMSNGHFFKGSKLYIKNYFKKKKKERRKKKNEK